ncbi:Pls/PosA family non-ribosomal peptide synthetase [Ottowia thiooxydans]|uniref:Pls/PosA family non-ribosomal peptide synthetase n=1 Tax=Ottowia thiooxydans TaxID=219182 RepID=UPI000408CBEA|nr:Pls/PosA family non-ribosomal peptide synthetase [Ottowia thiooxydans]
MTAPILHGPDRPDLLRSEILADIFEETAARVPEKTALIYGDRHLTYGELDRAANRVAHRLIEAGVRPGQMVGLWHPRGIELLVLQLAIAKTGAAWLPFDADVPTDRIAVCLEDAQAVALLIDEHHGQPAHTQSNISAQVLTARELLAPLPQATVLRRRAGALPEHTAYVIYTSGSTGKPKGIAITQASICHFLRSENARLGVREDDKVYQGFSVAFDMSFEEIWISYLVGATLWIAPKEIAGDPEALPRALIEHDVTVLHAVPTLLALFAQDVPGLRIINLGGEMCPQSLVERWAHGRQMFNTYGPTEATVSASLAELKAGEPVTIGEALPNYGLLVIEVIDPDSIVNGQVPPLKILPFGETGELCITGPGVAAGYLGRPELTAEKFLPNPWARSAQEARLYRTGDLARVETHANHQPQMQCLGRADDQVKIRGFRVELGEIEAVLAQQAGVGTTAVLLRKDDDIDQLIAFYVPAGQTKPEVQALRAGLAEKLPPYMVPARFEPLTAMPRLPSGKIDRKTLKALPLAPAAPTEGSDTPQTAAEEALFGALEKLFPGHPIRRELDFFSDLGGHSLFAARLISTLRQDPRFAQAAVTDIYQNRKIGLIAEALQTGVLADGASHAERPFLLHSPWRRWRCGVAQGVAIPFLVLIKMAQWLAPFFAYHFYTGDPSDSIALAVSASLVAFLLATVAEFGVAWAGKWLIAGRLKPGTYPLWGLAYYRWWLADRLMEAVPVYMINGSSLYTGWLRALGANIGRDVNLGAITLRAPELLRIGDGSSIGNAVNLENARVEGGLLHLGKIDIGHQACIGSYVVIEGDTRIGDFGHLEGQAALRSGQSVPARKIWAGSPARERGDFDPASLPPRPIVSRGRLVFEAAFFALGALGMAVLFFMPVFPTFMLIDVLDIEQISVRPLLDAGTITEVQAFLLRFLKFFLLALPASVVMVVLTALVAALIRYVFLPRMKAGSWPIHSNRYLGKWLVNQIQEGSLATLHGIYATIYSAWWYRLLGAKVGKEAELSTALGVVPDMLTLGDECFIADAVMLGDEHIDGGWMTVQPTVVSKRSFIGNGAYVPDGTTVPEGVLIGVMSAVPRNAAMKEGDTWLGSPPMLLPAREIAAGFPEHLTYAPSPWRRVARGLVEAFRIASPHAMVIAAGYAIVLDAMPLAEQGRWGAVALELCVGGVVFGFATFLFVALFKWLLLGRYRKRSVPMWTPFVWLTEASTNMYEGIAVPWFLRYLRGTPWLSDALNLMGCKIGRGVYMDTTDITEFDCVRIGDHSELNALCCPQTHLFEDRVMKVDDVVIGSRVTLGPRCTVLYGASVGDGAQLGPLTLVMKGESIPAGTRWQGSPAAPWRDL